MTSSSITSSVVLVVNAPGAVLVVNSTVGPITTNGQPMQPSVIAAIAAAAPAAAAPAAAPKANVKPIATPAAASKPTTEMPI